MSVPGRTNNPNGRPKGEANKRSRVLADEAQEAGADPAKILIDIISGAKQDLAGEPIEKNDLKWAVEQLLPYIHGKRKPVDSGGSDSVDPISEIVNALRGE